MSEIDSRRTSRLLTGNLHAFLATGGDAIPCTILNISEAGAFVRTDCLLPGTLPLKAALRIEVDSSEYKAKGSLIHSKKLEALDGFGYGYGFSAPKKKFKDISDRIALMRQDHCLQINQEDDSDFSVSIAVHGAIEGEVLQELRSLAMYKQVQTVDLRSCTGLSGSGLALLRILQRKGTILLNVPPMYWPTLVYLGMEPFAS